jgi:hypothetical protein
VKHGVFISYMNLAFPITELRNDQTTMTEPCA